MVNWPKHTYICIYAWKVMGINMLNDNIKKLDFVFMLVLINAVVPAADAGCGCAGGCSVGNWEQTASSFLNSDVPGVPYNSTNDNASADSIASVASSNAQSVPKPKYRSDLFTNGQILKPLQSMASSDVVIDASHGDSYRKSHVKGAIHIPSRSLIGDNGSIKSAQELARVLGEAGISRDDPIVVYSDDFISGDATLFFWALKYLGQDDVKVLDGSLKDWSASGLPVESSQHTMPAVTYTPGLRSGLLASYDSVKSSGAQIVDARPFAEFGKGRIPGAISLDPAKVIQNGKIKDESRLNGIFSSLSKDKPVIVYSSDYNQASVVWYALQLLGYNAEIYTWSDWTMHQTASESGKATNGDKSPGRYKKLGS